MVCTASNEMNLEKTEVPLVNHVQTAGRSGAV